MTPLVSHIWCVRTKLKGGRKRYGSYPAGTLEKFRLLMGVHITDPVLHVCGGLSRYYPYERGFGPNDNTRLDTLGWSVERALTTSGRG